MWKKIAHLVIVFLVATVAAGGQTRTMHYSESINTGTNLSLAVVYQDSVDVFHCGHQCLQDTCCAKFLYNGTSKHCSGVHLMQREDHMYEGSILTSADMYQKESCAEDWMPFSGHCYYHGQEIATWFDARVKCLDMCSHLVEIESQEESDWLTTTFIFKESCIPQPYQCSAWTGGNDLGIEGQFIWDYSNTTLNFTNWGISEPSTVLPSKGLTRDCVDILNTGKWNDRTCTVATPFICEKSWGDNRY